MTDGEAPEPAVPENTSAAAEDKSAAKSRRRRWVVAVILAVVAVIGVVASTAALWADRTVLDTDRFVGVVGPLIEDPDVATAVEERVSSSVSEALDVESRVTDVLSDYPRLASALAGPIATATDDLISDATATVIESEQFRTVWNRTLEEGHSRMLALLRGDYEQVPNITVGEEQVTLNLVPLIGDVLRQITGREESLLDVQVEIPVIGAEIDPRTAIQTLGERLGVQLPEDFGQVTVMDTADLQDAQDVLRRLERLAPTLIIITLLAIAGAILVAPNRRRMVIWLGVGVIAALLLANAGVNAVEESLADRIVDPTTRSAAVAIYQTVLSDGLFIGKVLLVLAVLAALLAYLAGPPDWLARITAPADGGSKLERWVAAHRGLLIGGSVLIAAVLVALLGVSWLSVIIVGAALGLSIWEVNLVTARVEAASPQPEKVEV